MTKKLSSDAEFLINAVETPGVKYSVRQLMVLWARERGTKGNVVTFPRKVVDGALYEDLKAALEFGATLDLTIEQRKSLTDLCVKIAGKLIPAYRLAESQELKKAAVARAEAAERRVIELEGALKYQRQEWQSAAQKR